MRRLVLGIGYPRCEYEATQNEWRQYGIEFEFADDFNQAKLKLDEQDYACVAVCADCLPYDDIDALRRVRPIPIVVLPAEYNAVHGMNVFSGARRSTSALPASAGRPFPATRRPFATG